MLLLWLQIDTEDWVEIVIPPLTFPIETEVTVAPVPATELSCSFSATRFNPFGFKEFSASIEDEQFSPPVRIYWRIPTRFRSLKQIKFVHTPDKGMDLLPQISSAMICENHGRNTETFDIVLMTSTALFPLAVLRRQITATGSFSRR